MEVIEFLRSAAEHPVVRETEGLSFCRNVGVVERILAGVEEERDIIIGQLVDVIVSESLLSHHGIDVVVVVPEARLEEESGPLDV